MKKLYICLLVIISILSLYSTALASQNSINIIINGKKVNFTEDTGLPYVDNYNRTMVPLRITMESCGYAVGYDNIQNTAIVITDHDRIEVPVGENFLYNNNTKIMNDTEAVIKNGRVYLPIRAVLESADYTVEWESNSNSVIAYNFNYDITELTPYSTGSLETLLENLLSGNIVYIDGTYYSTPDYVKSLTNPKIQYNGDDLNIAIYPEANRYSLRDFEIESDLSQTGSFDLDGML